VSARVWCLSLEDVDDGDLDLRRGRARAAVASALFFRGGGLADLDLFVETVDTEDWEEDRARPLSSSRFASSLSATPFLSSISDADSRNDGTNTHFSMRSLGALLVSAGARLGLSSC